MPLSAAQSGKAADYVLGYLARHGITAAEARARAGSSLNAEPVDVLDQLAHTG
jgi:hypothetical protein